MHWTDPPESEFANRRTRAGFDFQTQFRAKPNRSEHTHRVFAIARCRVTDHAQFTSLEIGESAAVVDDFFARRVVKERVDGKVPPHGIFLARTEYVVAQDTAMLVGMAALAVVARMLATKCRHLDHVTAAQHVHQLEAPADNARAAKQRAHALGRCIGSDIEVFWITAKQQVAHRAADHIGLEPFFLQCRGHASRAGTDALARHAVPGMRHHARAIDKAQQ